MKESININDNEQIFPISYFGQRHLLVSDLFKLLGSRKYQCLYDPFAGSGAISFAAMIREVAHDYQINDSLPALRYVWELIKNFPDKLNSEYSELVEEYCNCKKELRVEFYNKIQSEFNKLMEMGFYIKGAVLFSFLMNFSDKFIPIYDQDFNMTSTPNVFINPIKEKNGLEEFRSKTLKLSYLLNKFNTKFSSGDFLPCIETASAGDMVFLDPPYPYQDHNIYYKIKKEKELQHDMRNTLKEFNSKNIDFILLYGSRIVSLENQFDEMEYKVNHLIRLSNHPVFGHHLEHIYVSKNIPVTHDTLPSGMAFYQDYFPKNEEMSSKTYESAIIDLRSLQIKNTPPFPERTAPVAKL